jgi:ferric-dicitrate binding protein FerR (iron transport regulator)
MYMMGDPTTNKERIAELIFKHLLKQLSEDEAMELEQWRAFSPENEREFHELTDRGQLKSELEEYNHVYGERIWQKVTNEVPELNVLPVQQNKYVWFRIAVAAAVVLALLVGGWLLLPKPFKKETSKGASVTKDISPGGNRAILILSDGTRVVLDSAKRGELARQGKTRISKKQEGEVVYNANHAAPNEGAPLTYNTITTPRGGQYHVILPDGSHVWLNAASSIIFPTQFTGKERKVTVSGEAYFEVAKDKAKPFIVMVAPAGSNVCEISVLGTHFNVNAYPNELYANATLLEGKINFTAKEQKEQLQPGQQATIHKGSNKIAVRNNENAEASIAWVKGVFHFEKADVGSVMRQLSRWYDVDVVYEGEIPEQKITGDAERNIPLSELLPVLEQISKTHLSIRGRTIRVEP